MDQLRQAGQCLPDAQGRRLLEAAAAKFGLSHRACDAVLRVARSIADLAGNGPIGTDDISEALAFRRGPVSSAGASALPG